jgi:hypothetical protein
MSLDRDLAAFSASIRAGILCAGDKRFEKIVASLAPKKR